jgi:3-hydroxyisobutyrate dehydrogenase
MPEAIFVSVTEPPDTARDTGGQDEGDGPDRLWPEPGNEEDVMRVALLGAGTMGAGMARSLLRAGLDVSVWNRSAGKAAPLADDGASVCATPNEAVRGADIVLTMLYDVDSVLDVVGGVAEDLGDAVWVQSATIGLDGIRRVAAFAEEHGLRVLDAPVLGTKKPAEDGDLVVLVSGSPALRTSAQPVFDAIGNRTMWVGDDLGDASSLKLAVNAWVASITAATAQSVALARALGLDPQLFLDAIAGTPVDSRYAHVKGAAMIADTYEPVAFALDGVAKDVALIQGAAASAGVDTRLLEAVAELYGDASRAGFGAADMGAVHVAFAPTGD